MLGGRFRCDQRAECKVVDGVWHKFHTSFELRISIRYNADAVQTLPFKEPMDIVGVCTSLRFLLLHQEMICSALDLVGNDLQRSRLSRK